MNVYFSCSVTGGRQDETVYQALVQMMLADGHQVPTAHLSDPGVMVLETQVSPDEVYARDIAWLDGCDVVVAEVSTPSHGVGYEIAYALGLGKPVLCCYREGRRVSKMITGNSSPSLKVRVYRTEDELLTGVKRFLQENG